MSRITSEKYFEKAIRLGDMPLVKAHLSTGLEKEKAIAVISSSKESGLQKYPAENSEATSKLVKGKADVFNTRLPSGELPLHLAIRSNRPEMTNFFLEKGSDPLQRDIQRMQALDHASFSKNPLHKAYILSSTTGQDLEKVQTQMQTKAPGAENALKNKINKYKTAALSFFSPDLGKEVFRGDLTNIDEDNVNTKDANGLAPIHYAILGNQAKAFVDLILKKGADPKILGPDNDSLLHIAAMRNIHPGFIQILLHIGLDPNAKNAQGQTPLHYSSIEDNLPAIKDLVSGKADPNVRDAQEIAPLALVGSFVSERDPLKVSLSSFLIPVLITTSLLGSQFIKNGWITNQTLISTIGNLNTLHSYLPKIILAQIPMQLFLFPSLFPSPPQERTGIHPNASLLDLGAFATQTFFSSYLPDWCNTGLNIFYYYRVLRDAQYGFKTCYQNIGYRDPIKIGIKGLFHSISAVPSLLQIQQIVSSYFQRQANEAALKEFSNSLSAYRDAVKKDSACQSTECSDLKRTAGINLFQYYQKSGKEAKEITEKSVETDLLPTIKKQQLNRKELDQLRRDWSLLSHTDKNKTSQEIFNAGGTIYDFLKTKFPRQKSKNP